MEVEQWLARAAAAAPSRTAVQTPSASCTYAELLADARAGAEELRARGMSSASTVAIELPAGLDFARALHACLLLGAVAMPVDLRLSEVERARIRARADLIVGEPLARAGKGARAAAAPVARHELDARAVVIHTSGTTASPRPVELTYGNLLWSALGSAVALGLDRDERWLCALPLSHVGGLSILIRSAIYATTALVHERFETETVLRSIDEQAVTVVSLVGTTLSRLLDAGLSRPPTLRCALTGGGPVPGALLAAATQAGVPVSLTYGLTETSSQVTTTPLADLRRGQSLAGPPLFCTTVRVADDGEILVRGPTVAASAATVGGWLRTGDLGRLDADGRLHVSGRKADTIISGGENVAPAEVEAVLEAHPAVLEAAVLARADGEWGEAVSAIVVTRPAVAVEADELRRHCATVLAAYKVPKAFELREAPLPRTPSGKLLRRELA